MDPYAADEHYHLTWSIKNNQIRKKSVRYQARSSQKWYYPKSDCSVFCFYWRPKSATHSTRKRYPLPPPPSPLTLPNKDDDDLNEIVKPNFDYFFNVNFKKYTQQNVQENQPLKYTSRDFFING